MFGEEKMRQDHNKYDDKIIDVDEVIGTDVKIQPDFYIHHAIRQSQLALAEKDFPRYRVHIEDIEILAKAAKMLSDDYDKKVTEFMESEKYKKETDKKIKTQKIADFKKGILLEQVFSSKTITGPLKL